MQVGDATGACLMHHTALPRNGGAMQNAAGNPIRANHLRLAVDALTELGCGVMIDLSRQQSHQRIALSLKYH